MPATTWSRFVLAALVLVAVVGVADGVRGREWDTTVLFGVLAVTLAGLLAATLLGRPLVAIRADLARWLEGRASVTGDRPGALADRALAAYRAGLVGAEDDAAHGPR